MSPTGKSMKKQYSGNFASRKHKVYIVTILESRDSILLFIFP